MKSFFLIAGSPDAGTSLVASTLNSIDDIAIFAEFSLTKIVRSVDEMFHHMEDRQFAVQDPNASQKFLRPTEHEHRLDCIKQVWRTVYSDRKPRLFGNEVTCLAGSEDIDLVLKIPELKIIFVCRDCSAVTASGLRRIESGTSLFASEDDIVWEWVYGLLIAQYLMRRGVEILFVKYEDLMSKTRIQEGRIAEFLGVEPFRFGVLDRTALHRPSSPHSLSIYPDDLRTLVSGWYDLSAEQVSEYDLTVTREMLGTGWWPLKQRLCDIATVKNFHAAEPWGAWSCPGYFSLCPRFVPAMIQTSAVEIEINQPRDFLVGHGIFARVNSRPASVDVEANSEGRTSVTVRFSPPVWGEPIFIEIFSTMVLRYPPDPRSLGLNVQRYRLLGASN
jgi:hypothetical protein